jgi:hypothetical protein
MTEEHRLRGIGGVDEEQPLARVRSGSYPVTKAEAIGLQLKGTMPGVGEGIGDALEDEDGTGAAATPYVEGSLGRCGPDTDDNAVDFVLATTLTPGAANVCP